MGFNSGFKGLRAFMCVDIISAVRTSRFVIYNRMVVKYCNGMKNKFEDQISWDGTPCGLVNTSTVQEETAWP